jgi:hypothetical protein
LRKNVIRGELFVMHAQECDSKDVVE